MANIKSETTGQKHISTIATDIKQLISDISTGKPAKMTEENLNVFLNNIKLYVVFVVVVVIAVVVVAVLVVVVIVLLR